ncbi:helix-turn-helix domain-containing protein [Kitasatospora sp. NPDC004799]|uniref:helix-turn-helix domain-containing protein n=1 Tax=Kitasatospora sp. NPDC004799 TaxID=3154460 RepID=UPI0033A4623E
MSKDQGVLPPLYRPADIAKAIGMSEWWVKEQARRGRIPFTKPGRAYRFTAEQVAEIVRMYEVRPATTAAPQTKVATVAVLKKSARDLQPTRSGARLRARVPRRAALHQQDAA